jgi:branched-chain amino acid transport system permease protein
VTELAQNLIDALALGSLYALVALGITLVFTVMGMMNFAHGEFIMLSAYALFVFAALPFSAAVAIAVLAGILVALLVERLAFRPVRSADLSAQLVTSLAVAAILQNVVTVAVDARAQSVETPTAISESTTLGSVSVPNLEFVTLGLTAVILAALGWLLYRTDTGLSMRAATEDFEMARLLGVRANRVIAIAFAISGALAAIVGVLIVLQTGQVSPTMGLTPVLIGFVAVVIGGFGSVLGAVVGGLLLGAVSSLLGVYLPSGLVPFRDAMVFAFPVLILIFRPHGLLGGEIGRARV